VELAFQAELCYFTLLLKSFDHSPPEVVDIFGIIKSHKDTILKKIQIPFYIYSGKILQNYQQGLGVFISLGEGKAKRFRFVTGNHIDEDSHDAIHMLSSGQLSVIAIAFLLSLNKIYRNNILSKFLAIDDPVQSLDDLNIHTFIELIRHEFNDYQIIMSTHDDDTARYMNYKFKKFGIDSTRMNVQEMFYAAQEALP
jgi:DNA repair protein SbcC/Rad50